MSQPYLEVARARSAPSTFLCIIDCCCSRSLRARSEQSRFCQIRHEFKKTLSNCRTQRYGKAPTNGNEVSAEFEKQHVSDAYAFSLLQDRGPFFNDVDIKDTFENCIFSSSKSIQLILENTKEDERFFIIDGTFRITPNGVNCCNKF